MSCGVHDDYKLHKVFDYAGSSSLRSRWRPDVWQQMRPWSPGMTMLSDVKDHHRFGNDSHARLHLNVLAAFKFP